jgi:8-oxoguanine deaminase
MRFVATRGSMSVGQSQGGLPPDRVVENEDAILKDTQRLIEQHHRTEHGSMVNVAVAPCSPFSVSRDLMRLSAELARAHGTRLHTHLAENDHDLAYSRDKFNCTPTQYAQDLGWLGHDVWHAHCVKLDDEGISLFAATRTGVAHCPCSNMRLASGIAPVRKMLNAGVPVGLGVDGSASNDAAHMVNEARQALLLARVGRALAATRNPHRPHHGRTTHFLWLRPGACRNDRPRRAAHRHPGRRTGAGPGRHRPHCPRHVRRRGAVGPAHTGFCWRCSARPVASLLLCASPQAAYTVVNGKVVVREGQLATIELEPAAGTAQPAGPEIGWLAARLKHSSSPLGLPGRILASSQTQPRGGPGRCASARTSILASGFHDPCQLHRMKCCTAIQQGLR